MYAPLATHNLLQASDFWRNWKRQITHQQMCRKWQLEPAQTLTRPWPVKDHTSLLKVPHPSLTAATQVNVDAVRAMNEDFLNPSWCLHGSWTPLARFIVWYLWHEEQTSLWHWVAYVCSHRWLSLQNLLFPTLRAREVKDIKGGALQMQELISRLQLLFNRKKQKVAQCQSCKCKCYFWTLTQIELRVTHAMQICMFSRLVCNQEDLQRGLSLNFNPKETPSTA